MSTPKVSPSHLENGPGLDHIRTSVSVHGLALLSLSFQALGIIYSDIGTSPLYALNGIWPTSGPAPSKEDVIGGISAIIWALTLLPLIKYVFISLEFGTSEGEGGPFALFLGLYPRRVQDPTLDRSLTVDSTVKPSPSGKLREALRFPCMVWCLFGTALTLADGVFTPAVSVTSAVGGIAVAKPDVTNNIVPISVGFLVALFCVQRFGTSGLAFVFAPIAFIWFLLLIGIGIYNITLFPGIFRAFDPSRAVMLFVRTKDYDILSGVVLALTGCEAMFANLGQFNALSIRLSFSFLVYPAIVIAYLGQGARLIVDGENVVTNIFYKSIPGPSNGPLFWVVFAFGILATLVASQALITATFSLFQQLINTKYFPPLRLTYTSSTIQGQVYIPFINYSLMVVTVVVVAAFKNLTNLSNAYGFSVATVMFSTTVLLAVQMVWVKHWSVFIALGYFVIFGFLDGLFWGASLKKVPEGAWVSLMIGVLMATLMVFWAWAKGLENAFDSQNRQSLHRFISRVKSSMTMSATRQSSDSDRPGNENSHHGIQIQRTHSPDTETTSKDWRSWKYYINTPMAPRYHNAHKPEPESKDHQVRRRIVDEHKELEIFDPEDVRGWIPQEVVRVPTMAIFHKLAAGSGVPHTFVGLISQWRALPQVLIFLSVSLIPIARVPAEDRYTMNKVDDMDGFYSVTYNLGFRDDFDVQTEELVEKICALEMNRDPKNSAEIIEMIRQVSGNPTHIVPHYHVVSMEGQESSTSIWSTAKVVIVNKVRKYLIEDIYRRMATMFPETANWGNSPDEIIHVGITAVI